MLQRRRRDTHFRVEQLEGRAVPSIVAVSARIVPGHPRDLEITATTLRPTLPGNRVVITFDFQYNLKGAVHRGTTETDVHPEPNASVPQEGKIALRVPADGNHTWKNVEYLDPVTIDSLVPKTKIIKESSGSLIVRIT